MKTTEKRSLVRNALLLVAAMLQPQALFAQNECVPVGADPSDNGAAADSFTCSASIGTYTSGVTYSSNGDLSVESTIDNNEFGGNGIVLTGNGSDTVTFAADGVEIEGRAVNGALLDIATESGAIDILVEAVDADGHSASQVTHGIRALSDSGDINIVGTGTIAATGGMATSTGVQALTGGDINMGLNTAQGNAYGLNAVSTGGNIDITTTGFNGAAGNNVGAFIRTTGSGAVTYTGAADADAVGSTALDIATESGAISVNITDTLRSNGDNGVGMRLHSDTGPILINSSAALGNTNANEWDDVVLQASGAGPLIFNNNGSVDAALYGVLDLTDHEGGFTLNAAGTNAGWNTYRTSVLSQGDNTINNAADAVMGFSTLDSAFSGGLFSEGGTAQTTTLQFQSGNDTFNNAGTIVIGADARFTSRVASALRIEGLERFNNSGTITLGSRDSGTSARNRLVVGQIETDGDFDDVLMLRDSHFHGDPGSRVALDALFNQTGQTSCARSTEGIPDNAASVNPDDAALRANDCMDFQGSGVSGRTELILNDVIPGDRGAYNPDGNVVVDARNGDPAAIEAGAFVLSPESPGYNPVGGGFVDKGLFAYTVGYDAEDQTFRIYGVESPTSVQFPLLAQAAGDVWRSTTQPWFDRQAEQREAEVVSDLGMNIWLRGAAQSIDRKVANNVAAGVNTLQFDSSYTQNNSSLTFGIDSGRMAAGSGHWNVGAMFGYARGRVGFDTSPSDANLVGIHAGVYGSFTAGRFFQNIVINGTWLDLENSAPALQLNPEGTLLTTDTTSFGGQLETGWTFAVRRLEIEPLLSLSWVKTGFDDLVVPTDNPQRTAEFGGNIVYEDTRSLRTGLGVRLAMKDVVPSFLLVDVSLTAKTARETDGVADVTVENAGPVDARLRDTLDGSFNQLTGSVSLGNRAGTMAGYVNIEGVFGDDYDSLGASAGFRLMW